MRSWWRNGTGFDCAQPAAPPRSRAGFDFAQPAVGGMVSGFDCAQPAEPQPPPELVRNRSLSAVEGSIQRDCPSSRSLSGGVPVP